MAQVEQAQLKGLVYRTSKPKEITEDGKKRTGNVPVERPLLVKDILTETDHGDSIRIVTKDGQKYDIGKATGKVAGGKEKDKKDACSGTDTGAGGEG